MPAPTVARVAGRGVAEGMEFHVRVVGEGDRSPVLCLHSTGLSGAQWRRLGRRLAKAGHRSLLMDMVGYGESDPWSGEGPFQTQGDIDGALAVLDALAPGEPFHLVAHSYGGRVAMRVALARPDRVLSVGNFEPPCFGVLRSTEDAEGLAELTQYDLDGSFLDDAEGGSEAWMERFVDYWSGQGAWAEMSPGQREPFMRSGRKVFEEVRETCLDPFGHTDYQSLDIPMVFMSGSESTVAGRRVAQLLAEHLPQARHVEIEGPHMAPLLNADAVIAELMTTIAEGEARRSPAR